MKRLEIETLEMHPKHTVDRGKWSFTCMLTIVAVALLGSTDDSKDGRRFSDNPQDCGDVRRKIESCILSQTRIRQRSKEVYMQADNRCSCATGLVRLFLRTSTIVKEQQGLW